MTYFIYAEDLVSGLVGPFPSKEEAEDHVQFLYARGDADPGRVVDEAEAERLRPDVGIEMTPQQDRAYKFDDDRTGTNG